MTKSKTPTGSRWSKGTSGNRAGRPPGSRNKSTLLAEALLEGESEKLIRKAIELGLKGEPVPLRLCIERICPPRRERLVEFFLPSILQAQDAAAATAAILDAVAKGQLTPGEAELLARTVQIHLQILQTEDLGRRVAELEAVMAKASQSVSTEVPYVQSADPFAFDGVLSEDEPEAAAQDEATDASDDSTDATDQ
jgi:hypothetical protein